MTKDLDLETERKRPYYHLGRRVLFTDENQCEVRGVIEDRKDYADRIILTIALDSGGYYNAHLIRSHRRRHAR